MMTVRELMMALAQMDPDAVVTMPDTYGESEGWGGSSPVLVVRSVSMDGDRVYLAGEEDWDEDEDEEEP